MVWFKVDDGFSTSRPVTAIARRDRASAIGLWTLAGSWSAKELTDGHIARHMLFEFAATPRMAQALVDVGLWEEVENGWNFKNWARYQPTRDEVLAKRDHEAERKRSQRESRRSPKGIPAGREPESEHPDPTRPDPTPTDVPSVGENPVAGATDLAPKKKRRKSSIRSDFAPTDKHREKAAGLGVDVEHEIETFVDYCQANGKQYIDWDAAFNNWLRKAEEFKKRDQAKAAPASTAAHLRDVNDIERPPSGLTDAQYETWRREKPGRL